MPQSNNDAIEIEGLIFLLGEEPGPSLDETLARLTRKAGEFIQRYLFQLVMNHDILFNLSCLVLSKFQARCANMRAYLCRVCR
jgi:hypothetical protein